MNKAAETAIHFQKLQMWQQSRHKNTKFLCQQTLKWRKTHYYWWRTLWFLVNPNFLIAPLQHTP